ncbi:MAG: homoserine dehydrogenase [Acidimicrobiaceae bacterium]|nr:homoserine dehydrogenase [Acidimicrobiaceae bacterium]
MKQSLNSDKTVKVGVLGCGNVGSAFVDLLRQRRTTIEARTSVNLQIAKVAVRSLNRERALKLSSNLFTTDPLAVVEDPDIDIIVELIGGVEPPFSLVRRALELHKPVVTGNKALLAEHGAELFAAADEVGVDLLFEAAVAGGIPLMRPLRESLAGEPVRRVMGIVNGTTNYILTQMTDAGISYETALKQAQELGYAEADPTADVSGHDAAAKAAIIASIVFGVVVKPDDVYHEGIAEISAEDIAVVNRLGFVVKAVAIVEAFASPKGSGPEITIRVHPALVAKEHPLAAVRDSFNAVFIEGEAVGDLMFYGRGAGGRPTASAVLGDVVDAATNLVHNTPGRVGTLAAATIRPIEELKSAFYICLAVTDRPGVLAQVADVFGRNGVSIQAMEQQGQGDRARLIFVTHESLESAVQTTMAELSHLAVVLDVHRAIRMIGGEG